MRDTYKILFELQVIHNYFETGFCENLVYKISSSTQQLIDRYTLKFVTTDRGFLFYSTQKKSNEAFLNYITKATGVSYFEFNFHSVDQVFYQYTCFPTNEIGELLFESNHGDSESDYIVLKQQFQKRKATSNLFKLRIYFIDLFKSKGDNISVNYRIDFFSRATKWQYNVINKSKQHFNELSIKGDSDVEFDSGKEVVLKNGQLATCFTSISQEILFSQVPIYSFDLINTTEKLGGKKVKTVYKGLPMPNPKQIQIINANNTEGLVLSPMYVYI
jgi:hypothetical protein